MIVELLSLNNLAACLFMFMFIGRLRALCLLWCINACLYMQGSCLHYLKMTSSITIVCLVANGSLVWNVMSLKFWYVFSLADYYLQPHWTGFL